MKLKRAVPRPVRRTLRRMAASESLTGSAFVARALVVIVSVSCFGFGAYVAFHGPELGH